jgi:hypothetical protein
MIYAKMRHNGIDNDLKANLKVVPRIGELVCFTDHSGHRHNFKVTSVTHHLQEDREHQVYISGDEIA